MNEVEDSSNKSSKRVVKEPRINKAKKSSQEDINKAFDIQRMSIDSNKRMTRSETAKIAVIDKYSMMEIMSILENLEIDETKEKNKKRMMMASGTNMKSDMKKLIIEEKYKNLDQDDIQIIMAKCNVSRGTAQRVLYRHRGHLENALISLRDYYD